MNLATIDPGVTYLAYAAWHDHTLRAAGGFVFGQDYALLGDLFGAPGTWHIVVEGQDSYKGVANTQRILGLARCAGAVGVFAAPGAYEVVLPAQWKGQVPKRVMHKRILDKLGPDELVVYHRAVSQRPVGARWTKYDVSHAIGIGLWKFSRLR